jgi:2'-5' RNA ligase
MTYPVVMLVNDADAPRITRAWDVLAEHNYSQDQVRFGYPPHVTIALVKDDVKPEDLISKLKEITSDWKPLPVTFDSIAFLPRPVAPMLARPNVTVELLKANEEVCRRVAPDSIVDYSKPGAWQPHTTLARDIKPEDRGPALRAVLESWEPLKTTLDRVAVLHTMQDEKTGWHVKELWRHQL